MKKAQGMPLNVIIIAALVLMVLVILSVIFLGKSAQFRKETDKCQNNGGQCLDSCDEAFQIEASQYWCNNDGDDKVNEGVDGICCIST